MLKSNIEYLKGIIYIAYKRKCKCEYFILSSLSNYKMTTGITLKDYAKTTLTQKQQRNENEPHRSSTCIQRRRGPAQIAPWEISETPPCRPVTHKWPT